MKRALLFFGILSVISIFTWAIPKQDKPVVLILNKSEAEIVYSIIDDASVPGSVRKPLLDKIMKAYNTAFAAPVRDTSKPKKN